MQSFPCGEHRNTKKAHRYKRVETVENESFGQVGAVVGQVGAVVGQVELLS
jgi:hypothetical protein